MDKFIISIGRQYGSGGREIGEKLAERFGVPCYDKLLLLKAAEESGLHINAVESSDERPLNPGFFMSGAAFATTAGLAQSFYSDSLTVFEAERRVIENAAKGGSCIIIGRCAQYVLRNDPSLMSVFIYADDDERIERISERNGISPKDAKAKMIKVDRMRRKYFDFYCETSWGAPESYDILLSSTKYGIDGCVDILTQCIEKRK